jgi:uncharacterized protein (TIGR03437 family)
VTFLRKLVSAAAFIFAGAAWGQNSGFVITGSLPAGFVNQAYSATLSCNNIEVTDAKWSISNGSLPPGLGISSDGSCNATIGGTPSLSGTYNFNVTIYSALFNQSGTQGYTINVTGNLTINTSVILPNGVFGQNYSLLLSAGGGTGPYTWTLPPATSAPNALPAGLTLTGSGLISGVPTATASGTSTTGFTIMVTDSASPPATATAFFQLAIQPALTITTPSPLNTGTINTTYSQQIVASGGTAPYTFTIATPATAPPGMVITTGGLLSGVPKATGSYTFSIQVTDKFSYTTTQQFQISIAPAGPLLQTSLSSLTFSASTGGDTPPQQTIAVTAPSGLPVPYAATVDSGTPGVAPPTWITAGPLGGPTPAAIVVAVNQANLQPGKYSAMVHVMVPNNTSQAAINIPVTFNVSAGTQQLTALPNLLHFAARAVTPSAQDQMLVIGNSGGGGAFSFTASVVNKSAWISALTPISGRVGTNFPAAVRVFVNSQGLKAGFYRDTVRITTTSGSLDVPVELFVSDQGPVLGLSASGLRFQVRQGAGSSQAQSVTVLDLGDQSTTSSWTAQIVTGSDWLSIGPSSGTASPLHPGTLSLMPTAGAASLGAGGHYALVSVSDPNAINSPQYLTAVLDVASASSPALPDPSPGGLFFTSATPAQNVTVFTSSATAVPFQVATYTTDGNAWLSATPTAGNASTSAPGSVSVSVTPGKLPLGIYTGTVNISMNGAERSVNVTLVVNTAPVTGQFRSEATTTCSASKLALTETGLVSNFSVPAGWPATLILQLNDDCGNAVANASVVATFSNGDPPLSLRGDTVSNLYSATWQPGTAQPEMTITVRATTASLGTASAQYNGAVNGNPTPPPTLAPGGILHIFFNTAMANSLGSGLAPGNVAQVYGTGIASTTSPTVVPLPTQFSGTLMLIGGLQAPLFYVSDTYGLINVQVPFELTPDRQYSAIVSANGALTLPTTVEITDVQPGVAQYSDGTVIAQVSGTTNLISASNPAKPGQNLTIYLAGMGATNPVVPSGQPTPLQLVPVTNQPVVTLDGQQITYAYAGLTPTGVGLYQINFTVPSNARAGNLNLVITQNGVAANTTKLPVSN